jgi:hypothetical protein
VFLVDFAESIENQSSWWWWLAILLYIHVHKNVVLQKLVKKIEAILNSKP